MILFFILPQQPKAKPGIHFTVTAGADLLQHYFYAAMISDPNTCTAQK